MTITELDVQHQTSCFVGKVVLVLLIGALIDNLFLHRPFTPAHWGPVLAYLVWKASTGRAGRTSRAARPAERIIPWSYARDRDLGAPNRR
jgi:hypothetical protein